MSLFGDIHGTIANVLNIFFFIMFTTTTRLSQVSCGESSTTSGHNSDGGPAAGSIMTPPHQPMVTVDASALLSSPARPEAVITAKVEAVKAEEAAPREEEPAPEAPPTPEMQGAEEAEERPRPRGRREEADDDEGDGGSANDWDGVQSGAKQRICICCSYFFSP